MKKKLAVLFACVMALASFGACSAETAAELGTTKVEEDVFVKIGESWAQEFSADLLESEDCDSFAASITEVEGQYKYMVFRQDECVYVSPEYSGDLAVTTPDIAPDDYTIYIVNTGDTPLRGHVSIAAINS